MKNTRLRPVRLPAQLGPAMIVGSHRLQMADKVMLVDHTFVIHLTPAERDIFSVLLQRFLAHPNTYVSVLDLWTFLQETKTKENAGTCLQAGDPGFQCELKCIERQVNYLKRKLRYTGLEILRVGGIGWALTSKGTQRTAPGKMPSRSIS